MALPLSLQGVMNRVWTAKNNEQIIDRFVKLGEEFIKIIGTLLHTRYLGRCEINSLPFDSDLAKYISNEMGRPSFGKWARYVKDCSILLKGMEDRFIERYSLILDSELKGTHRNQARAVLKEISKFKLKKATIPRKPKLIHLLDAIVNLRNEDSHTILTEEGLRPLIDTGVRELLSKLIREFFDIFVIRFIVPISLQPEGMGCNIYHGIDWKWEVCEYSTSEFPPLGACFIQYFDDEDVFQYKSPLIFYKKESNQCMIYLDEFGVRFQYIDQNGESHKHGGTAKTVVEAFGIESIEPSHVLDDVIMDYHSLLEIIDRIAGSEMTNALMRLDVELLTKNILGNALLKELKNQRNRSWNWKEWYIGLFLGYSQSGFRK